METPSVAAAASCFACPHKSYARMAPLSVVGCRKVTDAWRRALSLKLQVVDEYRLRQRQKADGQCCAPLDETAKKFNVHKSLVSKWAAKED